MSSERVANYLLDQIEAKDSEIRRLNLKYVAVWEQHHQKLAEVWDAGYDAHCIEMEKQAADPTYPIHRPNPHRQETQHDRD